MLSDLKILATNNSLSLNGQWQLQTRTKVHFLNGLCPGDQNQR